MAARGSNGDGERADVLIVGSGASGAVVALRLAQAGFRVVCLEQGDWVNASDFPGDKREWELVMQQQWHINPNVRRLPSDYPIDTSRSDINPVLWNGVGGSTILYGACWPRFTPSDFRVRSLDGIADDWPFSYDELLPFYERIDVQMGVSGLGGDPAYPPGKAPPLPPLPIGPAGRKAAQGMNALGWHWWPGTNAIASRDYGRQSACVRRGTCCSGCPQGAKASTDITHWPEAIGLGARLVTGARVREITLDERGLASGAVYVDREGVERRQEADVVVLAANGLGTARLLLLSTSARFPDGLANSSGLVGKRLMLHPWAGVVGFFDEDLEAWLGPAGQPITSMEFYETDESRGFLRGSKWQVMGSGGPLRAAGAWFESEPGKRDWGVDFHHSLAETLGKGIGWAITIEDLPEEQNTVSLDSANADSDGIPGIVLDYRRSANSEAALEFNVARAVEALEAAGARRTVVTRVARDTGWHLLGTARMGEDPATSVVDPYGRAHDVANLYVVDGSVFVTSAGVNPTATIQAIALRTADHLVETRSSQAVPS